jgi:anti-anti-sigma regulatory factor
MLRITEQEAKPATLRMRLDGSLTAESFDALLTAIATDQLAEGTNVVVDMSGVDFMSPESARRLCCLRNERLRLINCSPFITALLNACQDKELKDETAA